MTRRSSETNASQTRGDSTFSWRRFTYGALIIFIFIGCGLNYLFYNIYSVIFLNTYVPLSGDPIDVGKQHSLFIYKVTKDSLIYIPTLVFALIAIWFFGRVLFWRLKKRRRARMGN